jgi:hypothetical protein
MTRSSWLSIATALAIVFFLVAVSGAMPNAASEVTRPGPTAFAPPPLHFEVNPEPSGGAVPFVARAGTEAIQTFVVQ